MKSSTVFLWIEVFFFTLLTFGTAAPAVAEDSLLNDSQEPGSVLVFPKFKTGTVTTPEQGILPQSEFEISAVCPKGVDCSALPEFPRVRLKAHWVCPGQDNEFGPPTQPDLCREGDFTLETTVNGTVYFSPERPASLSNPTGVNLPRAPDVPEPPCFRGYLIVWVINASGEAIKFDGLIGDAILRTDRFPYPAEAYNAIPIQAATGLRTGAPTDINNNSALDFDGTEYKAVTGKIFGTVRYPGPTFAIPFPVMPPLVQTGEIRTSLTLLTLDVRSNRVNDLTYADLFFYNEDEVLRSVGTTFVCWMSQELDRDNFGGDALTNSFGRKGLVRSAPAEQRPLNFPRVPVTLLGIIETRELNNSGQAPRAYAYSLYNDSTPVATTFFPDSADAAAGAPPAAAASGTTVTFDNPVPPGSPGDFLNGQFQGIDFGASQWRWEDAYGPDSTRNIYFASESGTARTFSFSPGPRTLSSMNVFTGAAGTLTLTDNLGQSKSQSIATGSMQAVTTGWTQPSTTVTVTFTAGWELALDDIAYR